MSTKEKPIENQFIDYIVNVLGGYCVKIHSGKIKVIKNDYGAWNKGKTYSNWMILAPKGTPDLNSIIQSRPVLIEVKKSEEEVKRWHRIIDRYLKGDRKESNMREYAQYEQMIKASKAGAVCIIAGSLNQLKEDLKANGFKNII